MKEKILKLLETKFQGTRKDGLSILAGVLAMTATDDETAQKVVDALTADQVKDFITDYRKGADAEITKANQTAEENLRKKYDFVEKGKKNDPEDKPQPNIEEIIQKATAPLLERIAGLEGQGIKATRRAQFDRPSPLICRKPPKRRQNSPKISTTQNSPQCDCRNSETTTQAESVRR